MLFKKINNYCLASIADPKIRISKSIHNEQVKYSAWKADQLLGVCNSVDRARVLCAKSHAFTLMDAELHLDQEGASETEPQYQSDRYDREIEYH